MGDCEHPVQELRQRSTSTGAYQFAFQCVDCGQRVGNWVKKPAGDVPAWDWEAEQAVKSMNVAAAKVAYDARRESEHQLWWRGYQRFIQSPLWKTLRHRVITRADSMCEACLVERAQQVHHTRYPAVVLLPEMSPRAYEQAVFASLNDQPLYELRAICYECHAKQHPHMQGAA